MSFFIWSYFADLSKSEDLVSLKRGTQTMLPCHRCLVPMDSLSETTSLHKRILTTSSELLDAHIFDENMHERLKDLSMHCKLRVLASLLFVGIDACNDVYAIFSLEPMHNLSLGTSKLLYNCLLEMLCDETSVAHAVKPTLGAPKTFKFLKEMVIDALNKFLRIVQSNNSGFCLCVDFSKGNIQHRIS